MNSFETFNDRDGFGVFRQSVCMHKSIFFIAKHESNSTFLIHPSPALLIKIAILSPANCCRIVDCGIVYIFFLLCRFAFQVKSIDGKVVFCFVFAHERNAGISNVRFGKAHNFRRVETINLRV